MAFGKEIKRLREKAKPKKISAQKIGEMLGVGVDKLRQWEARDTDPVDEGDIRAIESKFGMPLDKIATLDSLPKFEKNPGTEIVGEGLIDLLINVTAEVRVALSILAEIQASTMDDKLPTQLLGIYRTMVNDEAVRVRKELFEK